jgi:hypothetical protein
MEIPELERRLSRYRSRRQRLSHAIHNEPVRTNELRSGGICAICTRDERTGGLIVYRLRGGSELLVGHRCAEYLDYLLAHPGKADDLLRD